MEVRSQQSRKSGGIWSQEPAVEELGDVCRKTLTEIADLQYWLKNRSEKWGAPILEPPDGDGDESRRDRLLDTYFHNAKPNQVVAILKAREPARILVAIGDSVQLLREAMRMGEESIDFQQSTNAFLKRGTPHGCRNWPTG